MLTLFTAAVLLLITAQHSGYADADEIHLKISDEPDQQKPTICRIVRAIPTKLTCEAVGYTIELQGDKAGKKACCRKCSYNTTMVITCPEYTNLVKQKI